MDPPYSETTHEWARTRNEKNKLLEHAFSSISFNDLRKIIHLANVKRWIVSFSDIQHASRFCIEDHLENFRFVRFGAWIKPDGCPQFTGDHPGQGWEAVMIMHRKNEKMRWNGGGHHGVWTCNIEQGNHPTQKPLKLVRQLIEQFTDKGDLVLDPFCGSGTTLRAAMDLGRKAIGIEMNERYCEYAVKRLSQQVLFE
jgi:site-specific DNA-methyltransferase (adenine-specific)